MDNLGDVLDRALDNLGNELDNLANRLDHALDNFGNGLDQAFNNIDYALDNFGNGLDQAVINVDIGLDNLWGNLANGFNHIFNFFKNLFTRPPPPPPDNTKKKKIVLKGISIEIIEVPPNILTMLRRNCDVSPNFSLERASTYISIVLRHGNIPEDLQNRIVLAACDVHTKASESFKEDNKKILKNFFLEYKESEIMNVLSENKNFLINTIDYIERNPSKFSHLGHRRDPHLEIEITDPVVSLQLDELYKDAEKERKKKEKEEEEEREIEQAKHDGSLVECGCCICEYPKAWMIHCPRGHSICKKCVERQIETVISEGRSNVPCLNFGGCSEKLNMNELEKLIPKKTLKRLFATETLNAITEANIENTVKCHKCGYIVVMDEDGPMNCPRCKSQTCTKCGAAWHPNMTCEEFGKIDKDRIVEEQMNDAVVRTCPRCKTQFMKDEGCNKMECPRCHTWICYWCRKVIPKEVGYNHFWREEGPCPPDKCPLWVQNDTLHLIEAENAKDKAKDNLK